MTVILPRNTLPAASICFGKNEFAGCARKGKFGVALCSACAILPPGFRAGLTQPMGYLPVGVLPQISLKHLFPRSSDPGTKSN